MRCKAEEPCLWAEHFFVSEEYRCQGIVTLLFNKAEDIAKSIAADTAFNYVNPNNEAMIHFIC